MAFQTPSNLSKKEIKSIKNKKKNMKSLSDLFKIANITAMVGWAVLILLPNWAWADTVIKSGIVVALSVFYVYVLFIRKNIEGEKYPKGSFATLEGVVNLFKNPKSVLGGWVHYLAFDLMLGLYIKHEANAIGMPYWLQIPCYLLTFMFGPAGYLLFWVLQMFMTPVTI
jgi:hypothetical protein